MTGLTTVLCGFLLYSLDYIHVCISTSSLDLQSCRKHCGKCSPTFVDCSNRKLTHLPLHNLPYTVERLILDNNKICRLTNGSFHTLSRLRDLSVQGNNLTIIDEGAFKGLHNLTSLKLNRNKLQNLPDNTFRDNVKLNSLNLQGNNFTKFPDNVFGNLERLQELTVSRNSISEHALGSGFHSLKQLQYLDISYNKLPVILPGGYFTALQNSPIQNLDVSFNHITLFPKGTFSIFPHLTHLNIQANGNANAECPHAYSCITNFEKTVMYDLRNAVNLSVLNMQSTFFGNDLPSIPQIHNQTFRYLQNTSLQELIMTSNYNSMLTVYNGTFRYFPKLEALWLDNCYIRYIQKGAFEGLKSLKYLSLTRNLLACINMDCPFFHGVQILTLKWLDISTNGIAYRIIQHVCGKNDFAPNLETLIVENNRLYSLPGNNTLLTPCKSLKIADFSYNKIKYIKNPLPYVFSSNTTQSIILRGIDTKGTGTIAATFGNLPNLHKLDLGNSQIKYLPEDIFFNIPSLRNLSLDENALKFLPKMIFAKLTHLEHLDLSNNILGKIPAIVFQYLKSLIYLNLANNVLYNTDGVFMALKQLTFLNLSINSLTVINKNTLAGPLNLKTADLYQNDFQCTCDLKWFKDWLNSCRSRECPNFVHLEEYQCANIDNKSVKQYKPSTWDCRLKQVFIVVFSVLGGIITALLILGCCYRNRFYVRHFCFVLKKLRATYEELYDNTQYKFDAFICYNDGDLTWVKDQLLDTLLKAGIKLCIDFINFRVGATKIDTVMQSIRTSRKTVLVISQHFLRDNWNNFEMNVSAHSLFEEGKDNLVIIFLEPIPYHEMPPSLQALVRTKKYLEWSVDHQGAELFWETLCYSLKTKNRITRNASRNSVSYQNSMSSSNNDEHTESDALLSYSIN